MINIWAKAKKYLYLFKNKIILNFVIFVATNKVEQIFPPPLLLLLWDPGPGTDKHPGSPTLYNTVLLVYFLPYQRGCGRWWLPASST